MGDSKTTSTLWTTKLVNALRGISNWSSVTEVPARLATAGWNVGNLLTATDAWIAGAASAPNVVLINIGVNDVTAGTSQSDFETRLGSVLDKVHTAWPDAVIYVAKVWRGDQPSYPALCDTMNDVWMENVLGARPWATFGLDERLVIRDPDGGVTKTSDFVHYNSAGDTALASAWQALIEGLL
jgi:hypothetical protein